MKPKNDTPKFKTFFKLLEEAENIEDSSIETGIPLLAVYQWLEAGKIELDYILNTQRSRAQNKDYYDFYLQVQQALLKGRKYKEQIEREAQELLEQRFNNNY